jgi:hypothetical protein
MLGSYPFRVVKAGTPTMTLYNPSAANSEVRNESIGADCSAAIVTASDRSFVVVCTTSGATVAGNRLAVHWTANARLV